MVEFILLIICSIFLARYLEKRSTIVSAAHAVLFIVLMVFYYFSTENQIIAGTAINLLGKENYDIVHSAFVETSTYSRVGFGTLFVVEIVVNCLISFVSLLAAIKAIQLLLKKAKITSNYNFGSYNIEETSMTPNIESLKDGNVSYLVFERLLN